MHPFDKIAAENATIPVSVVGKPAIHGFLKLDDRKTSIELSSTKFFHFDTDEHGWCDIALLGPKGLRITAHNAVFSKTGQSWGSGRRKMHYASIFPNMLIMDSRGHSTDGKVAQISFYLTGFNDFFHYQYTEQLNPFDLDDNAKSLLKSLRYSEENTFDTFDLSHIYICHSPRTVLQFEIEDRKYRIWSGGRGTFLDWHGINLSVEHGATVEFKTPVSLDEALDRVYEWRQFFNQMAMVPLPISAISVAATNRKRVVEGEVYIPYLTEKKKSRRGLYGLHPKHIPLNRWEDRDKLANCMKSWLSASASRRAFRGRVDGVIEHMQRGTRQSDVSELCAGIDSLVELKQKSSLSKKLIESASQAAFLAFGESAPSITVERISGMLGQMQNRSLSEKMLALAALAFPENYQTDAELIISLASKMRQDSVHRAAVRDQLNSALQPVVEALACLCIAFDLGQSGVPIFESNRTANCVGKFFKNMNELRGLSESN
jgi:hypothetical protein